MLGQNLLPDFKIHTGHRRVAYSQLSPLEKLGVDVDSKEVQEREAWVAFWDAPFVVPGVREGEKVQDPGLPRTEAEIHRVQATFNITGCEVKTDGARIEVNFPGLRQASSAEASALPLTGAPTCCAWKPLPVRTRIWWRTSTTPD